jgi:hypothetical protein
MLLYAHEKHGTGTPVIDAAVFITHLHSAHDLDVY